MLTRYEIVMGTPENETDCKINIQLISIESISLNKLATYIDKKSNAIRVYLKSP